MPCSSAARPDGQSPQLHPLPHPHILSLSSLLQLLLPFRAPYGLPHFPHPHGTQLVPRAWHRVISKCLPQDTCPGCSVHILITLDLYRMILAKPSAGHLGKGDLGGRGWACVRPSRTREGLCPSRSPRTHIPKLKKSQNPT